MTAYWTAFLSFAEKIRDSERNGLYLSRPRKGEYLGEVNGVKCYEFKGKADAILVDLGKYVSPSDGSIYESLYVAELIG